MGGMTGKIRGKSKIEVYLKYVEVVEGYGETFQEHDPDPKYKKNCKSLMEWDPDAGEWALHYHLHT